MTIIRKLIAPGAVGLLALFVVACAATKSATLTPGMTPDQTVQAMGEPDLKDSIADPNHSGASVLRYVWLEQGKAAIFGSDERLASIQNVETNTKQQVEQQAHAEAVAAGPPQRFDPIETPLNYLFFPVKAATIYFGAGLNCAASGDCQRPQLPPPSAG
ncbi:MAG: hypothetical protein ACREQH_02300 [Candidatus Binatus sp.]